LAVSLPDKQRLRLFESTLDGVDAECALDIALESYLENTRIGVRRLQITRTPEFLLALSNFVQETKKSAISN